MDSNTSNSSSKPSRLSPEAFNALTMLSMVDKYPAFGWCLTSLYKLILLGSNFKWSNSFSHGFSWSRRQGFWGIYHRKPLAVIRPAGPKDMVRVVKAASLSSNLTVAARGLKSNNIKLQVEGDNVLIIGGERKPE
ncbi:hypothetical protein NE237_007543 [Protea cynaroides]|uniref:Uncharacterized protein n=1 Tax=Protea cynaroides TaxID=273540 RepID=A0A9Q0QWL5_9MAGN|nr:hypothetical protein NE237_007543 [Protea cynaroides]